MYLSINDFVELCTESYFFHISIFSLSKEDIIWSGRASDIPDEYAELTIESFDSPEAKNSITINVD